jgi:hypothetical protein
MPRIGPCPSCGVPEGWPHGRLCARAANLIGRVLPSGVNPVIEPGQDINVTNFGTEGIGVDRCGRCNRPFAPSSQPSDLCFKCRHADTMAKDAEGGQEQCHDCHMSAARGDPSCHRHALEWMSRQSTSVAGAPRGFDPMRPWGADEIPCRDCQNALAGLDGKGYRDGCDRHVAERTKAAYAEIVERRFYNGAERPRYAAEVAGRVLAEKDAEIKSLQESLGIEATLRVTSAVRAQELSVLLRRALPMLADLVPTFADAEKLCGEIKVALDPKSPTLAFVATT